MQIKHNSDNESQYKWYSQMQNLYAEMSAMVVNEHTYAMFNI